MADKASKIYFNGTVLTMNPSNEVCRAVALSGDRIMAVGEEDQIRACTGPETELVNLKGATLMPGFYDSHGHVSSFAEYSLAVDLNAPPIGKVRNIGDLLASLREWAEKTPPDRLITGTGYNDAVMEERRHPTRYDLDLVSKDRPVIIRHISGHLHAVNSKALEMAGITKDTPDPPGGRFRRDPSTGEPDGVIEEFAARPFVEMAIAAVTDQDRQRGYEHAGRLYASQGVTTASDGLVDTRIINRLRKAVGQGHFPIRAVLNIGAPGWLDDPNLRDMDYAKIKKLIGEVQSETDRISFGGIKFLQDGSIQGYTAYLSGPYHTPFRGDPGYAGYPIMPREDLLKAIRTAHAAGFQCVVHANGDAAIDDVLFAFKKSQEEFPRQDPRHVIVHCQTVREDQLDLIKELGAVPTFFVLHTYYWGDVHHDVFLGPGRAARISPLQSALDRGIIFATHCDTPVVPQNPLLSIWAAVNRTSYSGKVLGPEYRIPVMDALRTYTINAAYQNFEEDIKGSIEVGKLADLVILNENPLACDPVRIKDIQVLETIVGGQTVYKK